MAAKTAGHMIVDSTVSAACSAVGSGSEVLSRSGTCLMNQDTAKPTAATPGPTSGPGKWLVQSAGKGRRTSAVTQLGRSMPNYPSTRSTQEQRPSHPIRIGAYRRTVKPFRLPLREIPL